MRGLPSARGGIAGDAVSVQIFMNPQHVSLGVRETVTLGLQNVVGEIAKDAASARPCSLSRVAETGAPGIAQTGVPSVLGKIARDVMNATAVGDSRTAVRPLLLNFLEKRSLFERGSAATP